MTVCVAAICDGPYVVGASDRMLTTGGIVEYEPAQPKIIKLTRAIAALTADDSTLQSEILQSVKTDVDQRIAAEPQNWWAVRDVASLYTDHYNQIRGRRAEQDILAPLGLTYRTWQQRQQELAPNLANRIADRLWNFEAGVQTLIIGLDMTGAHIYLVSNGVMYCHDSVGFAAVGIGAMHASSHLMSAQHDPHRPLDTTLFQVYAAKRRGEVAPGVGVQTDMILLGPQLGLVTDIPTTTLDRLLEGYEEMRAGEQAAVARAEDGISSYLDELRKKAKAPAQVQASGPVTATPGTGEAVWTGHAPTVLTGPATPPGATGPTGPTGAE